MFGSSKVNKHTGKNLFCSQKDPVKIFLLLSVCLHDNYKKQEHCSEIDRRITFAPLGFQST